MTKVELRIQKCFDSIKKRIPWKPEAAVVLGSGLGPFTDAVYAEEIIPFSEIREFPQSTVEGHQGRFVFGQVGNVRTVIMQGRVHYYEGYSMEDVCLPVRLMRKMGAEKLILTCAAGGLNPEFKGGELMLIKDQISCFVPSPLRGPNPETLGVRFPDMSEIYDKELCDIVRDTAAQMDLDLKEGVYIQMPGPNYESPAEVRMCRTLGADAVAMSTACEAVAAKHCGFRICGIACVTNPAAGMQEEPLSHEEVQAAADKVLPVFKRLLEKSIIKMK